MQQFARLFVHYREALSVASDSSIGLQVHELNQLPCVERERMVAAARLALIEIESTGKSDEDSRRYYAKPGQAGWGC